jgi:hypothetical protein
MSVNVNIPFVAPFQSDGAADLQTVISDTYALGAADVILTASTGLSAAIINAFVISHEDASDSTVALSVTMGDQGTFAAALAAAMQAAAITTADAAIHSKYTGAEVQGAGTAVGLSLEKYVKAGIHTDVIVALNNNTIAAELEASDVLPITLDDFAGDCLAAANAMWEGLNELSPAMRRLVATQLDNSKYVSDASEGFTAALPLESGDSMTFQFTLNSNLTITNDPQDLTTEGGATNAGTGPAAGTYPSPITGVLGSTGRVVRVICVKA